jgi:uncharacterized membrane protein
MFAAGACFYRPFFFEQGKGGFMSVFFLIFVFTAVLFLAAKVGVNPARDFWTNARLATGLTFIFTGVTHFLFPETFLKLMPPFIPLHLLMIYISGFFEILGGVGLMIPATKRAAAYGLILLLLAVFPANVYVALENVQLGGFMSNAFYQWLRLPLQFVLIWWVYRTVREKR